MVENVKHLGVLWIDEIMKKDLTYTKPGSILYLLYGKKPSEHSINIKLGKFGEFLAQELVKINSNLEMLKCGVELIGEHKRKDIDLLFKDEYNKIIYYRELKANIKLDTEKIVSTICKCRDVQDFLQTKYLDYTINCGLLNWSIYRRCSTDISRIKIFENSGILIEHMYDFLKLINIAWEEDDFYTYFRKIGVILKSMY